VTPVSGQVVSLSKHYNLETLAAAIGKLSEGMDEAAVGVSLPDAHQELADDLFVYDEAGGLVVDTLVTTCREGAPEAPLLTWVALLLADERLQGIVTEEMTTADGSLDPQMFSKAAVEPMLEERVGGAAAGKGASNLLRWYETAGLVEGRRDGKSVSGLARTLPTAGAVPATVQLLSERLAARGVKAAGADGGVELALGVGANHWLGLTAEEFRRAARPPAAPSAPLVRDPLPAHLSILDSELRRKGQAVLQGPPGVGKTHTFEKYLDWFSAGNRDMARLTSLAQALPSPEASAEALADSVHAAGLPGVWELVQFHPSYSYERFIRGLQATPVSGGVSFEVVDRTLAVLAALGRALLARGDGCEVLLVVDEINRADTAKVFGELLYGLEYRGQPVSTPYALDGDSTLTIPENLYVLGTMNTADQSIAMVDKALRRRFGWIDLAPDPEVFATADVFAGQGDRDAARRLFEQVATLFADGGLEATRLSVGHSYFLPEAKPATVTEGRSLVARKFAYDCWPLLEEYEAEGLLDGEALEALLADLGWKSPARPAQVELRSVVEEWLAPTGTAQSDGP
jgi:5-methylcytosine-specific restriction enzyme B